MHIHLPFFHFGAVKSFEDLANDGPSYPYLHVIRMDVDSLGKIFIEGISKQKYSMARIANLSRELDLFFTGYLNILAEEHQIYITYSGGDDLFVVGHWESALKFAMQVREKFREFTCNNPNITISGGSFLMRKNFPIRRAAELCGKKEEDAKQKKGTAKNCFSIFDEVLGWERLHEIIQWSSKVREIIQKDPEHRKYRSLIRYAKSLHDKYFDKDQEENVEWISKIRHKLHYVLARRANITHKTLNDIDNNRDQDEREFIEIFSQLLDPRLMENIVSASTYIILATRETKKDK
jgi:CRISPR-associated protein Csm1